MRDTDIQDKDIPAADPAAVVQQYEPLIRKIARRYIRILERTGALDMDDLHQVGRCAVLNAQKAYDPVGGASFASFIYNPIRWAMLRALGFSSTGELPVMLDYLDEPLSEEDGESSRLDMIPDPTIRPFDEPLIEEETRQETAVEVRAALARLKSDRQRDIIGRIYFDGQERKNIAAQYGVSHQTISSQVNDAFRKLRHDMKLRRYAADTVPFFHVGANRFNSTWTSATEEAVIWREEHLQGYACQEDIEDDYDTGRGWTPAQHLAYMKRLMKKRHPEPVQ